MKLQVVSNFNRLNNEATSCFWAQTRKDETKCFFELQTTENEATSWSTSNKSEMKLKVVSNFNRVNNEATSCFRAQTSKDETKSCF